MSVKAEKAKGEAGEGVMVEGAPLLMAVASLLFQCHRLGGLLQAIKAAEDEAVARQGEDAGIIALPFTDDIKGLFMGLISAAKDTAIALGDQRDAIRSVCPCPKCTKRREDEKAGKVTIVEADSDLAHVECAGHS